MFFAIVLIVIVIFMSIYLNGIYWENYWRKRGVVYDYNNKYFGPIYEFLYSNLSVFDVLQKVCDSQPNAPAVGLANFFSPNLVVQDLTNIQSVLASDFNSFNHRGFEANDGDLLADNILFMTGKRWKLMRQHMSPLFSSTKLKSMYYIIDKSAKDFVDYLKNNPHYLQGNTNELVSTFCSAAIGAAVFGVGTESIFDSPFLKMARNANKTTYKTMLAFATASISPAFSKFLGIKVFTEHEDFFIGAVKQIIRAREQDKVKQHDFADICVSLQSSGVLKDHETGLEMKPTDELLAAQAFFFFIAGVEPTAAGIFGTLVELGRHPEVLRQVHEEIDKTFEKHTVISYDVLSEMEYLDQAVSEALRLHPPISNISRLCIHDTVLPVGNIKIDKRTQIFIPVYQIHHDEKYYTDPEKFKPERFSKQNRPKIIDAAYMPFGKGNRSCMGMRYASLQIKAGLVHLLRNYTVKTVFEDSNDTIKYKKDIIQMRISNADVEFSCRTINNVAR